MPSTCQPFSDGDSGNRAATVLHPRPDVKSDSTFAVVTLSGTQYKVAVNDIVITEKIRGAHAGETLKVDEVLLVGSIHETIVGRPLVEGAEVTFSVEEQRRDKKSIVFKKKRRKGYRRKAGHRRDVSILRVVDIQAP